MHRSSSSNIFFFSPFSRERISLPKFELPFMEIAFSLPPTSDNCVVVALNFVVDHHLFTISTCHPGATEWITKDFYAGFRPFYKHSKLVYLNGRFYLYNAGGGCLYSFLPSSRTWDFLDTYIDPQQQRSWYQKTVFLGEKRGELFLMITRGNEKPMVYKMVSLKWEKMSRTKLDGLTIFVSLYNSELRTNLPLMRNTVYFSRFGYKRKRCVSYSFDECRYNGHKDWPNWLELCPSQSIWIDPPKNVIDYL